MSTAPDVPYEQLQRWSRQERPDSEREELDLALRALWDFTYPPRKELVDAYGRGGRCAQKETT